MLTFVFMVHWFERSRRPDTALLEQHHFACLDERSDSQLVQVDTRAKMRCVESYLMESWLALSVDKRRDLPPQRIVHLEFHQADS